MTVFAFTLDADRSYRFGRACRRRGLAPVPRWRRTAVGLEEVLVTATRAA